MRTLYLAIAICGFGFLYSEVLATADVPDTPYVLVLGTAQDGGYPQAGCEKQCCQSLRLSGMTGSHVTSLAIIDPISKQRWIIDCTPDFPAQLSLLDKFAPRHPKQKSVSGIFLTHAHVGHYAGLINLGREIMGAQGIQVSAMPRCKTFLETQGPWSLLVKLNNITLRPLEADEPIKLNSRLTITPFLVPHRDEFSETVGFIITGPDRKVLFIPDIDKWEKWDRRIEQQITTVDRAYLDGTFYNNAELPGRDISQIPHPFISESITRFAKLPDAQRDKVHFIHLNHTNAALSPNSDAQRTVSKAGMHIAQPLAIFKL